VTVLIQERTFKAAEDPTPLDRLLRILYYSVWSYLLLAVVALLLGVERGNVETFYDSHKANPAQLVWPAALLILVPSFLIANATRLWTGSRPQGRVQMWLRLNDRHEQPTAWDFFFRQQRGAYVRVTTDSGGRIHGYYGPSSFAAYAKDGNDLYLERTYVMTEDGNEWFGAEVGGGCGVWVPGSHIVSVEFYNPDHASEKAAEPGPEVDGMEGTRGSERDGQSAAASATPEAGEEVDA
jgi:hypothetical protein